MNRWLLAVVLAASCVARAEEPELKCVAVSADAVKTFEIRGLCENGKFWRSPDGSRYQWVCPGSPHPLDFVELRPYYVFQR
jgi:hypothetical protein